jgi:hypothetical protein
MVRIVVDFTALNDRDAFVEQIHQAANNARLALPAFSEEDHVVTRQDGVFYFGNDRLIIADDPRQNPFSGFEAMDEILAHLLANRQHGDTAFLELSYRFRVIHVDPPLFYNK